jgi:phosphohistidine phosphatase
MKFLYILRHAQPQSIAPLGNDFDRQLNEKGKQQVPLLAAFLEQHPISVPFECVVSTAKRTQQTFAGIQTVLEKINYYQGAAFYDQLYHASQSDLLQFLWNYNSENNILLVGHNNGISDMVSYFTGKNVHLEPADFICLAFDVDQWKEISADLATVVFHRHF